MLKRVARLTTDTENKVSILLFPSKNNSKPVHDDGRSLSPSVLFNRSCTHIYVFFNKLTRLSHPNNAKTDNKIDDTTTEN